MDILTAKQLVIEAGEKLVEAGLIARTWGNVSCRVDDKTFVITPSGKPYIGLTPDDIVEVAIADLAWSGDVKPSSEKGIHAEVYKAYPEANFVIHTHQKIASAISALKHGIDTVTGEAAELIGNTVLLGSYGLPGTKTLRKGVTAALKASPSKAVIMAHHGALCFGKDLEEAFAVAHMLEKLSASYLLDCAKQKLGIHAETLGELSTKLGDLLAKSKKSAPLDPAALYNSSVDRTTGKITFQSAADGSESVMDLASGLADASLGEAARMHRDIYLLNPALNNIIHNAEEETVAVSRLRKTMKPLLDDFTQICGTKVKCAKPARVGKAIKGKNAVLVRDQGALCCGKNSGDAQAVDMIMSKSCLALLATKVAAPAKPINPVEALLMRVVYLKKYSKQAE
jgi:L-fuculose-phosphate aldolase